jgi:hypothetical protein
MEDLTSVSNILITLFAIVNVFYFAVIESQKGQQRMLACQDDKTVEKPKMFFHNEKRIL